MSNSDHIKGPPGDTVDIAFEPKDSDLVSILIFVVWTTCLLIGLVGFAWPYPRPQSRPTVSEPVKIERIEVQLKSAPTTPKLLTTPDQSEPSRSRELTLPPVAEPVAVAEPSAALTFVLPVEAATRITSRDQAAYKTPPQEKAATPSMQKLTFGEGEGKQAAPDYPRRSIQERQEGTVVVRFIVGQDGRVTSAEAAEPCRWHLLNESAVRTVRERWRFSAGPVRVYEVPIRFQLTR